MNNKQKTLLIAIGIVGITAIIIAFMITQTAATMTFHITSDNNTLEIFKTINYDALINISEVGR